MSRRLTEPRIVIASHNPGKLREMQDLLAPFGVEAVSAAALGLPEPEETGTTFVENAVLKAAAAARLAGFPALADDSGLAVDALGGSPGIHSARWAGEPRDFGQAMERVERLLHQKGATSVADRGARFISVLAIAWPDGHVETFEGVVEGTLVWPPRGRKGFGYDPMFLPDGFERTFGEMSATEKHGGARGQALSHRARAFQRLAEACLSRAA
jgi:XTP/dITP diphosphohydrolase